MTRKPLTLLFCHRDMLEGLRVGVVVPARDEIEHIRQVIGTLPDFVDVCIVVDDGSSDGTGAAAIQGFSSVNLAGEVLSLSGVGVGAAIDAGHQRLIEHFSNTGGAWCSVVMAGDGQMDPADLRSLLEPLLTGEYEHVKGGRSAHQDGLSGMPLRRRFGTALLAFWTSLACGRTIRDPQCGYTATSGALIERSDWCRGWAGYGYPNHWLMRMTEMRTRITEVPVRAVYGGERSGLRLAGFIRRVAPSLLFGLHRRGWAWYVRGEVKSWLRWPLVACWIAGFLSLLNLHTVPLCLLFWGFAHLLDRRIVLAETATSNRPGPVSTRTVPTTGRQPKVDRNRGGSDLIIDVTTSIVLNR